MAEKDLFAPLSEDEKKLFKPLSKEEREALLSTQDMGDTALDTAGDAALGAAQGATLGFADEMEAAVRSLVQEPSYEDLLKSVRQRYAEAEASSPYAYTAGNIGGGLATSFLPVVGATGAASTLSRMALAGGVGGAINAVGTTEKDKLSLDTAGDAALGASVGAGLGVGLGAALPAVGKMVGKKVAGSEVGEDVAEVFKKIRSGKVDTFGREATDKFAEDIRNIAEKDIIGGAVNTRKKMSASYEDVKDLIKQQNDIPVEVLSTVNKLRSKLPDDEVGISPSDLKAVQLNLSKLIDEQDVVKQVAKEIDPVIAEQKAMEQLNKLVAVGDLKAERQFAREMVKNNLTTKLSAAGMEGKELNEAVKNVMAGMDNDVIDQMVVKIRESGLRQPAELPKELMIDPVTGIPVAMAKRVDADIAVAAPQTKLEKVIEKIPGRTEAKISDINKHISNIETLIKSTGDDKLALKQFLIESKQELEALVRKNTPDSINQAKDIADAARANIAKLSKNLKINKFRYGKTEQEWNRYGKDVDDVSRMVKNYAEAGDPAKLNLDEFLKTISDFNPGQYGFNKTPDQLKDTMKDASRNMILSERATGTSGLQGGATGVKGLFNLMQESVRAKTLGTAEMAGQVAKRLDKSSAWAKSVTPQGIIDTANKITNTKIANALRQVATMPEAKRRAMLFSMMQQPGYREAITGPDEE